MATEFANFDFWDDSPIAAQLVDDVRTRNRLERSVFPRPRSARLISVTNQKGGVGKTTTVVNLAASLSTEGMKVLVVDLDPQGNASTALSIPHGDARKPSSYDVLVNDLPICACIKQSPKLELLSVIPSTIELASADLHLAGVEDKEFRIKRALDKHLATEGVHYDYVFFDCPPSMGLLVVNALTAANEILVTIQAEYYALEGLALLNDTVRLVKEQYNPSLEITSALVTMYDSRTNLSVEVFSEVKNFFPNQIFNTVIPRNVQVSEAPSHQETVITYDPRSTGSLAYREAALELAKRGVDG